MTFQNKELFALAMSAAIFAGSAEAQERSASDRASVRSAERTAVAGLRAYRNLPPAEGARKAPRIIGGSDAEVAGLYEFTGSIRTPTRTHHCGGSFVDPVIQSGPGGVRFVAEWAAGSDEPRWFITAAHCLFDTNDVPFEAADLTITAGSRDISASGETLSIEVDDIIVHPNYDETGQSANDTFENDIALLKLSPIPIAAVGTEPQIRTITLPDSRDGTVIYQTGARLDVNGWGRTGSAPVSWFLQAAKVPYGDQARCELAYSGIGASIADGAFCAGWAQGGIDSCQGDSGGPLIDRDKNILIGVVSWGDGCGFANKPGVYTDVTKYIDWINENKLEARVSA